MSDKTGAYAAAELASALRGEDPGEHVRGYAGLVDDRRTLAVLNYYDGLLDEPIEETRIGRLIISNAATETIDEAVRHGSVSQMKSATGLTGQEREGGDLYRDAAGELAHEGAIGLVFGAPGSGKTATTLDVAMAWKIRTGGALIGNTSWDGFDHVVRSDREMLEAMAEIEGPVLAVLDEIAQELSGFGSGNKAAEQFSDSLLFIRKKESKHGPHPKRGSVLLVGHTRTKTAKSIRRVASLAIEKPSRSDPGRARLLESEGGKDDWEEGSDYKGLTDTAADYPEHEPSEFAIELVDEDDDSEGVDADSVRREEAVSKAIRAVENHGMTYADAGDLVGYSAAWVSDRMAEYRNGDHGEVVNDAVA
ncbi:hypothetical protein [Halorubrum distributum]|uniref:Uncharacterized protein n=1 Tax=Halorubrum distributum JCM 10247 TaxID=1227486 RepID=M0DK45_9EURY|nr:hypothetical protein [Halorubrum terrestre]ELZ35198.1 hypothetical protein C473_04509 [Halorubrum terrestre JCM 10247]